MERWGAKAEDRTSLVLKGLACISMAGKMPSVPRPAPRPAPLPLLPVPDSSTIDNRLSLLSMLAQTQILEYVDSNIYGTNRYLI